VPDARLVEEGECLFLKPLQFGQRVVGHGERV
jgi:hypothetical protein